MLRLRPAEEIAAKRARRKRREKEKEEKAKGKASKGKKVSQEEVATNEAGAQGDGEGEGDEVGAVRWEERVAVWCTVRANAKVKSFALAPDGGVSKAGVSVSARRRWRRL